MPRALVRALTLSLCLASTEVALAQSGEKLDVRAFAPPEYRVEGRIDFAALVESGFWEAFARGSTLEYPLAAFRDAGAT